LGGCSSRAHGSHPQLSTIESLYDLDYVGYLAHLADVHCLIGMTYSRNEMVKHLLNIADGRQILAEILDSVSNLVLHTKRLDAGPERTTDGQLCANTGTSGSLQTGCGLLFDDFGLCSSPSTVVPLLGIRWFLISYSSAR